MAALTAAFDLPRLKMMLRFHVGKDLELETGGASGEEVFFNLIGKAERAHWLPALMAGAIAANPTDALKKIEKELRPQIEAANKDHFNTTFVDNNLALVNRTVLRDYLRQLTDQHPTGARILLVNGPPLSGKSYSVRLISYLNRALKNFRFVWIDLKKISGEVRPEHLAMEIVDQMALDRKIIPELNQEQDSRWVRLFASRLQGVIGNAADIWWIVIDGFNHARLSTAVNDLIRDLSERRMTMPELRIVLLSYPDSLSPDVERVALRETIAPISREDLIGFFAQIYKESQKDHSPKDIADSIGKVMRAADPKSSEYMEMLSTEVVKVVKQITT